VRYEPEETISYTTSYEASIDKFDYLITFPLTEHRGAHKSPIFSKSKAGAAEASMGDSLNRLNIFEKNRISWAQIKEMWSQVAFGTDEDKDLAVEELSRFWTRRTGSTPEDQDLIRLKAWQTVAREAILEKLTITSGLQCKLTANSDFIFCRVRAPIKLLESQADKIGYRLQLRDEIDPGSDEFWNRELLRRDDNTGLSEYIAVELEEEKKQYSQEEAIKILERLYKAGKISPYELGIKDETQAQWSLRIHALERIIDKVPVFNKYPAYADFKSAPEKRHLYNTYSTVRGRTLFRSKDRLCLTKSIMDGHFDLEKLTQGGVVSAIMALHDANRGEKITKDILRKRWVGFYKADALEVGCPFVTHPSYNEDAACPALWRPFAQPLAEIRDYFGEKIALYFAWLGYYTCALSVLFCFSIALYVVILHRGKSDLKNERDWFAYLYFIVLIVWSEIFQRSWHRENAAVKVKWGTDGFTGVEEVRPQFHGVGPLVRSAVDNNKMAVFPHEIRLARAMTSYCIILLLIAVNLGIIFSVYYGEYLLIKGYPHLKGNLWLVWGQACAHAFILQTNAILFPKFVANLNDWENYRTATDYENALIIKTLVFQVTNNFAAATFTTFGKGYVFDDCAGGSCIGDLRILLLAIIFVRMAMTFWQLFSSMVYRLTDNLIDSASKGLDAVGVGGGDEDEDGEGGEAVREEKTKLINLAEESGDDIEFQEETKLTDYQGTFNSYSESALQFGFVSLFSVAMPLLAVYALFENFFLIRVYAWRLCALHRRPHVIVAEDIGGWDFFIHFLSYMGVIWGCGIIVFAGPNFQNEAGVNKIIIFLSSVLVLCMFKVAVSAVVPQVPEWVRDLKQRNQFVYKKYIHSYDNDINEELNGVKGVIADHVDVDALNLYDLRKNTRVTEEEYVEMGRLEAKRRVLMKEIRLAKEHLQLVYKTEIFNENTGIGETKHGLPLGRLSVKLIQIEGLMGEGLEDLLTSNSPQKGGFFSGSNSQKIVVNINIRAIRKGASAARDFGVLARSEILILNDGCVKIDQIMGPYAPIQTIDAEVVFSVLNVNEDYASIAMAVISLRELQDQVAQDLVLPLKVRLPSGKIISPGRLFLNIQFQFSKVLPLRRRIYEEQGRLREVEHDLALLKAGKAPKKQVV